MADEQKQEAPKQYFLITVGDGDPEITRCEDKAAFTEAIQAKVLASKDPIHAFGFVGERINIAAPSPTCTVKIGDELVKLGESSPQFDESGLIIPLVKREIEEP